jgi:hypothetical protein
MISAASVVFILFGLWFISVYIIIRKEDDRRNK